LQQEKVGVQAWWHLYLTDLDFRRIQEAEAYHQQYLVFCAMHKDRNMQARFLFGLASDFSGELYGKIVSYQEATKLIREGI